MKELRKDRRIKTLAVLLALMMALLPAGEALATTFTIERTQDTDIHFTIKRDNETVCRVIATPPSGTYTKKEFYAKGGDTITVAGSDTAPSPMPSPYFSKNGNLPENTPSCAGVSKPSWEEDGNKIKMVLPDPNNYWTGGVTDNSCWKADVRFSTGNVEEIVYSPVKLSIGVTGGERPMDLTLNTETYTAGTEISPSSNMWDSNNDAYIFTDQHTKVSGAGVARFPSEKIAGVADTLKWVEVKFDQTGKITGLSSNASLGPNQSAKFRTQAHNVALIIKTSGASRPTYKPNPNPDNKSVSTPEPVRTPEPPKYTVSFNANGGSGSMEAGTVSVGSKYTLPSCGFTPPAGKEFFAWEYGGTQYQPGTSLWIESNTTVRAVWADKAVVTFEAGGGTGTMDPITVAKGNGIKLPECGFTAPKDKGFKGWKSGESLYKAGDAILVNQDMTFTAEWEQVVFPVSYDKSFDGWRNGTKVSSYKTGEALILGSWDIPKVATRIRFAGYGYRFGAEGEYKTAVKRDGKYLIDTTGQHDELILSCIYEKAVPIYWNTRSFDPLNTWEKKEELLNPNHDMLVYYPSDNAPLIFVAPENFYVYPGLKFKTFEYAWGGKNYQPMEPIRNEKGETVKYRVDTTGHKEALWINAVWLSERKISFDKTSLKGAAEPVLPRSTFFSGDTWTLPKELRNAPKDWKFIGWKYSVNGGEKKLLEKNEKGEFLFDTGALDIDGDVTFYAQYTGIGTSIVYDEDSFHGVPNNPKNTRKEYKPGEKLLVAGIDYDSTYWPSGFYFRFYGWKYRFGDGELQMAEKGEKFYEIDTTGRSECLTLYAIWYPSQWNVDYMSNPDQLNKADPSLGKLVSVEEDRIGYFGPRKDYISENKSFTCKTVDGGQAISDLHTIGWAYTPDATEPEIWCDSLNEKDFMTIAQEMLDRGIQVEDIWAGRMKLYSIWGYDTYRINYGNIADDDKLPKHYNSHETLMLPTAEEMNQGELAPMYSEKYNFLGWSTSPTEMMPVSASGGAVGISSLGGEGEIKSGDVTLYAVFEQKIGTEDEDLELKSAKEFEAFQVEDKFNLMDTGNYSVVRLHCGEKYADPASLKLLGVGECDENGDYDDAHGKEFFELCPVDSTKAQIENGETVVGIRLRRDKCNSTGVKLTQQKGNNKLRLRVRGMDEKGNKDPYYTQVVFELNLSCTVKGISLSSWSGFIYEKELGKDEEGNTKPAVFHLSNKDGMLNIMQGTGTWEYGYAYSGSEDTPVSEDIVKVVGKSPEDIIVYAYPDKLQDSTKGYIIIRNSNWVEGVYRHCEFNLTKKTTNPSLKLSSSTVELNDYSDKEKAVVTVSFSGGMELDPSKLQLDENTVKKLSNVLRVSLKGNQIIIKGKNITPAKSYSLGVVYDKGGLNKSIKMKICVKNTSPIYGLKLSAIGNPDAVMGGTIWLKTEITGFSGEIVSVRMNKKNSMYDAAYDGHYIVLKTNENFVYQWGSVIERVCVKLSTGVEVSGDVSISTEYGSVSVYCQDRTIYSGDSTTTTTPLIVQYTYTAYNTPMDSEKRIYFADEKETIRKQSSLSSAPVTVPLVEVSPNPVLIQQTDNGEGPLKGVTTSLQDGMLSLTVADENLPLEEKSFKIYIRTIIAFFNEEKKAGFNLKIEPKGAAK